MSVLNVSTSDSVSASASSLSKVAGVCDSRWEFNSLPDWLKASWRVEICNMTSEIVWLHDSLLVGLSLGLVLDILLAS